MDGRRELRQEPEEPGQDMLEVLSNEGVLEAKEYRGRKCPT